MHYTHPYSSTSSFHILTNHPNKSPETTINIHELYHQRCNTYTYIYKLKIYQPVLWRSSPQLVFPLLEISIVCLLSWNGEGNAQISSQVAMRRGLWVCEVRDDLPQPATTCHDLRPVVCCHNTDSTARLHVFSDEGTLEVFCFRGILFRGNLFISCHCYALFFFVCVGIDCFCGLFCCWNMLLAFLFDSRVLWSLNNID